MHYEKLSSGKNVSENAELLEAEAQCRPRGRVGGIGVDHALEDLGP